ncbi:MAG: DUF4386 domain-containing protein [Gemmatimonadetes bacterium]|nr:DUF4386 domain-containing protein [Gemmatimonadota bacterium]
MYASTHRDAKETQRLARTTGLLYLVVFVLGMFSPIVLEQLLVAGDAAGTADNILGSMGLFSSSLVSWVVIVAVDVAMAAMFYLLLEPAGRVLSLVSAAFRFVYAAILGTFLLDLFGAFLLLARPEHAAHLEALERQATALTALETFSAGFLLALAFFGVHLASLGVLLYRSRYVPRALGAVLAVAGVGYVAHSLASFFVTSYGGVATAVLLTPAVVGELGLALWLLIKGLRIDAGAVTVGSA